MWGPTHTGGVVFVGPNMNVCVCKKVCVSVSFLVIVNQSETWAGLETFQVLEHGIHSKGIRRLLAELLSVFCYSTASGYLISVSINRTK